MWLLSHAFRANVLIHQIAAQEEPAIFTNVLTHATSTENLLAERTPTVESTKTEPPSVLALLDIQETPEKAVYHLPLEEVVSKDL